jgi:hypothetical protein
MNFQPRENFRKTCGVGRKEKGWRKNRHPIPLPKK